MSNQPTNQQTIKPTNQPTNNQTNQPNNLRVDGRIKNGPSRNMMGAWIGLIWLRTGTSDGF
jgi:hypothetical protein